MTQEERWEARRLYRESGYRREQVKILCELYQADRKEMLEVLAGMPSQEEAIRREFQRGMPALEVRKMYRISETTLRRMMKKWKRSGQHEN